MTGLTDIMMPISVTTTMTQIDEPSATPAKSCADA